MRVAKIGFRNLFRHRRRSLLTVLTMAAGYFLCSLSFGVSDGTYSTVIDAFTRNHTGHIQVHRTGYLEKPSLYNTIDNVDELGESLSSFLEVASWTPRLFSAGLASVGKKTAGARITGVQPGREAITTRLKDRVTAGRFLSDLSSPEVMIGRGLAEVLRADVEDELVLIAQAADGSIANDVFRIVGFVGDKEDVQERMTCYLHLRTVQDFLVLPGRVHEIAVVLEDHLGSIQTASLMQRSLDDPSIEISPWQVVEKEFYQAMEADLKGMWISLAIIMVIVAIGVLNTVLMSILERTREFGVLRALGTRPADVFKLVLSETFFLGVFSVLIGGAASLVGNHLMSVYGIAYPEPVDLSGFVFDRMVARISPRVFWIPGVLTFATAVVVSIFPAVRAARVAPVQAMRTY